jgi:hypothetical protein
VEKEEELQVALQWKNEAKTKPEDVKDCLNQILEQL